MVSLLRSPYAASKLAGEAYCRSWWLSFGVPTVSLRYFNVYGPGQDPENEYAAVVPRFVMACMNGTAPEVHGDGEQSRDFTYIDDVIDANLPAGLAPRASSGKRDERRWRPRAEQREPDPPDRGGPDRRQAGARPHAFTGRRCT
jgi:nucleoside-diphosphate-sugar epimerase